MEAPLSDRASILVEVCNAISANRHDDARAVLREKYPFVPLTNAGRHYTERQILSVCVRDGFLDRYSGHRLVSPPALRLISSQISDHFPFQTNWRTDACHFAFWELSPTVDHIIPVSRGGADQATNWVTTSMLHNSAKANFTLEEIGWALLPPGSIADWDGLLGWFIEQVTRDPSLLKDSYLRRWYSAGRAVLAERTT
jgi:hypothetical protein